jgi:hypothetical protein
LLAFATAWPWDWPVLPGIEPPTSASPPSRVFEEVEQITELMQRFHLGGETKSPPSNTNA